MNDKLAPFDVAVIGGGPLAMRPRYMLRAPA